MEAPDRGPGDRIDASRRDGAAEAHARHEDQDERGAVLSASGIVKSYTRGIWPRRRSLKVLRGADLVLRPGEIVGLVGENGSGKSTLMKILVRGIERDGGGVHPLGAP